MNKFPKCISVVISNISKRLALDVCSPILLIPLLVTISTINIYSSMIVIFLVLPALLCHIFLIFRFSFPKKKFFYVWSLVSMFFVFVCFEILIVPLMVISPSENIIFYILFSGMLLYTRRIQKKSSQINAKNSNMLSNSPIDKPFIAEKSRSCKRCIGSLHSLIMCSSCQIQTSKNCRYNAWTDCVIGRYNHKNYCFLLFISLLWLGYTSYLILTTICHSHLMFNWLLFPSDCSNVYATTRSAVCFVGVLYSIEIIAFISVVLIRECALSETFK